MNTEIDSLSFSVPLLEVLETKIPDSQTPENLQKSLLDSKKRLCDFLKSEISRNQNLLEEKVDEEEQIDDQPQLSDETDRQIRLRVLRFGLDERRKKLQDAKNEADSLASKFDSLKMEAHQEKVSAITEMLSKLEDQKKLFHSSRNKSDIDELDSQPVLLHQNLEDAIKTKKAAIEKLEQDSELIKAKIRRRCKQMKNLQPKGAEASKKIQKLDDLNHRLSQVSKRLDFAENLDRRAQDIKSRQELQVERVKMKFAQIKELYAEEKRVQLERVSELKMEKEEYAQKLMSLNKKLDRLGRQNLLKGTQGAFKWIMASFDIPDSDCDEEVDEFVGKRCVFICQEIKRLQQHSMWLEENLKAVESKSLTRQKISAIKAVLDRGANKNETSDVRRREQIRLNRPRPISMIETGAKKLFRSLTTGSKMAPSKADSRRRTMIIGQPTPSHEGPKISATQRRLAYSQSLRERRVTIRTPLPTLQREIPSTSASLSFHTPAPLIYTAFRSSKHTASSRTLDFAV
ncbi:hypothetical protein Aperf_G00000090750 [Anoplocephala perfoliata]